MQWVPSLESNHITPANGFKSRAGLRWGQPYVLKVIVSGELGYSDRAGDVDRAPAVHFCYDRMPNVIRHEDKAGILLQVPPINLIYSHNCEQLIFRISER